MGIGKTLSNEAALWGSLAIIIIVFLVIFNKLRSPANTALAGAYNNNTSTGPNVTIASFLTDFSSGIAEPKNWVAIFFIALIGFGIITFIGRKGD